MEESSTVPSTTAGRKQKAESRKEETHETETAATAVSPESTPSTSPAKTEEESNSKDPKEEANDAVKDVEQQYGRKGEELPEKASPKIFRNLKQLSSKMLDNLSSSPKTVRKRALEQEMEEKMKLVMNHLDMTEQDQSKQTEKPFRFSISHQGGDSQATEKNATYRKEALPQATKEDRVGAEHMNDSDVVVPTERSEEDGNGPSQDARPNPIVTDLSVQAETKNVETSAEESIQAPGEVIMSQAAKVEDDTATTNVEDSKNDTIPIKGQEDEDKVLSKSTAQLGMDSDTRRAAAAADVIVPSKQETNQVYNNDCIKDEEPLHLGPTYDKTSQNNGETEETNQVLDPTTETKALQEQSKEEELKREAAAVLAESKNASGSFRFYSDKGVQEPDETANLFCLTEEPSEESFVQEKSAKSSSGSFRFYPDEGVQEPKTEHQNVSREQLSAEETKQEISRESSSGSSLFHSDTDVDEPETGYLNVSARETLKDKRVSSRLLLAQENDLVPVRHSRGSEVASRVADYEKMKVHLHLLVEAAKKYQETTMQLELTRSHLFQNLADFANGTPLKEVVGTSKDLKQGDAPGESSLLAAQNVAGAQNESTIRKYQQDILRHAEEWQDTVTSQVDEKVAEYKTLKREYFHYNFKTAKLRRRAHIADSWNIQLVSNMLSKKSSRNESKMEVVVKKYKEKTNEICFLLEQVTNHGWKDLYPLVESTIEWEIDRLSKEQEPYGTVLIATLDKMKLEIAILEEEETAPSRSFHGTSECIENADALSLQIDPSKPTLFLDDACPFTARVWITLLEKEADPFNPTGFHVIPVCTANSQDPGLSLLKSLGMDASPVLVHNGNVFSESTRVAEYIDKAFRHPLYHSIPPLRPNSPIDVFNMKTFMKRHSKIAEVFYDLMDSDDESSRPQLAQELFDLLGLIDEDLRKFQGSYFCGQQFTLADVSIFPFVEHIKIILASFGATVIPESLTSLLEWYDIVSRRPSIQMVTADRTEESTKHNSVLTSTKRGDYLIEYHQNRCDHIEKT